MRVQTSSRSATVSVAVLRMGYAEIVFIQPAGKLDTIVTQCLAKSYLSSYLIKVWCGRYKWSQWRYTVFPIVFPVELGCFHLFYPITKLLRIFARNSNTLLRIDYVSTCVIHFKCTLLLEDIISWHVGGRVLWRTLYISWWRRQSIGLILLRITDTKTTQYRERRRLTCHSGIAHGLSNSDS